MSKFRLGKGRDDVSASIAGKKQNMKNLSGENAYDSYIFAQYEYQITTPNISTLSMRV